MGWNAFLGEVNGVVHVDNGVGLLHCKFYGISRLTKRILLMASRALSLSKEGL
jgi:hypothetical protein